MPTIIRGIEAFVAVVLAAFFSQVTIEGQPLDLTSNDGKSRLVAAFLSAVLVAARQWIATHPSTVSS